MFTKHSKVWRQLTRNEELATINEGVSGSLLFGGQWINFVCIFTVSIMAIMVLCRLTYVRKATVVAYVGCRVNNRVQKS